jgi:hypothetical protein
VLFLAGEEQVAVLVGSYQWFHDTSISVNGPLESLHEAFDQMAVAVCCEPSDQQTADEARSGFLWEGREITVDVERWDPNAAVPAIGLTEILDGRVALPIIADDIGYSATYTCGGYSFTVDDDDPSSPEGSLLSALEDFVPALDCGIGLTG